MKTVVIRQLDGASGDRIFGCTLAPVTTHPLWISQEKAAADLSEASARVHLRQVRRSRRPRGARHRRIGRPAAVS